MAVVTITITDDESTGGAFMTASSVPPIPESDDDCTPAMVAGAMVMKLMEQVVQMVRAEGEGE